MKTTKTEREDWVRMCEPVSKSGDPPQRNIEHCEDVVRLCRDVDTVVRSLEKIKAKGGAARERLRSKGVSFDETKDPWEFLAAGLWCDLDSMANVARAVLGGATVDGKRVEEAPPPVAATCAECRWEFLQLEDRAFAWKVASCHPEHHIVELHSTPAPLACIAIDKVSA